MHIKRTSVKVFIALLAALVIIASFRIAKSYQAKKEIERKRMERIQKKRKIKSLSHVDALPEKVRSPSDNVISNAKIELGRLLFYDPILSGGKDVACATCHHPSHGYAEFRDISIGVGGVGLGNKRSFVPPQKVPFTKRNAHTILNTAFNGIDTYKKYSPEEAPMFWDLRAKSLEAQAIEPLKAFEEMRGLEFSEVEILPEIVNRLKEIPEYSYLFSEVFHEEDPVTISNVGKAIAAFERSLVTNNSRFDLYKRGDENALSLSEKDGLKLFIDVGCAACHNGPMFSDFKLHVLGVPANSKLPEKDKGFEETNAFRTPTLRNLRFTSPYMHNGSFLTLEKVLEFYQDISQSKERNPDVPPTQFDSLVSELNLNVKQMAPIISFLNSLNDPDFDKTIPDSVPSGLPVGGNIY